MKQLKTIRGIWIICSALTILILLIFSLVILFSPYGNHDGYDYKLVKESVAIKAPISKIYQYLGNSDNARQWSSYVHHISTLNEHEIADGELGSIRRCFVNSNEVGKIWDEEILSVEINHYRRLSCYNFVGFEITAGVLNTEQLYEETWDGNCLLSLTLFLPQDEASLLNHLKMYFAGYRVSSIFKNNLQNIKMLNGEKAD